MTVWIVVQDAGVGDWIQGVYASPEAAKRAHPGEWVSTPDGEKLGDFTIEAHEVIESRGQRRRTHERREPPREQSRVRVLIWLVGLSLGMILARLLTMTSL